MTLSRPPERLGLIGASLAIAVLANGLALTSAASGQGRVSRSAGLTARIELVSSQVVAGRTLRGRVVFENPTSRPRVLLHGCRVDGLFAMGLRGADGYLSAPIFSLVGCDEGLPGNELIARPGRTVFPFQLVADYTQCAQDPSRSSRGPAGSDPLCLRWRNGQRDVMPPLPAGPYSAVFVPSARWHGPRVSPARVVVTAKS